MKYLISLFMFLSSLQYSLADSLWIEAEGSGKVGIPQTIKVIFGSYNQYRLQKVGDEFQEVKDFTCWMVSPSGKHIDLEFSAADTAYQATFTPMEEGVYIALLENKQRNVEDWSNSTTKIGITKQHYYARTYIKVGDSDTVFRDALTDLSIVQIPAVQNGKDLLLQVLFHGKPVPDATVTIRHPQMKEQLLKTDVDGKVVFHSPKPGRYFALAVLRFETPGTYKGVPFDVFREKSTLISVIDQ